MDRGPALDLEVHVLVPEQQPSKPRERAQVRDLCRHVAHDDWDGVAAVDPGERQGHEGILGIGRVERHLHGVQVRVAGDAGGPGDGRIDG